jgi:AcrR family transcriptional regulator
VLDAAIAIIAADGLDAVSFQAIADRAGVARATIYRRWPNREALLNAALRRAIGRDPFRVTGDLIADLRRGARQSQAILAEPMFATILPALTRGLLAGPHASAEPRIAYDVLFPNRAIMADAYREQAARNGLRTDIDPELVVDLVIGAPLSHLLATGRPLTRAATDRGVELLLAGLRTPAGRRG